MEDYERTGVGLKIKWAIDQLGDLEQRRSVAFKISPYGVVPEDKPDAEGWLWYRWQRVRDDPIPAEWGGTVSAIVNSICSALDILWRSATDPMRHKNHFPRLGPDELKARIEAIKQTPAKMAHHILLNREVFEGGRHDLKALRLAWDEDKHEVPLIVGATMKEAAIAVVEPESGLGYRSRRRPSKVVIVKDGERAFAVADWLKLDEDAQFTLDIAFGEATPLAGELVLPALNLDAGIASALAQDFFSAGLLR